MRPPFGPFRPGLRIAPLALSLLLLLLLTPAASSAAVLEFDGVLDQALGHSYPLRIAASDIALAQIDLDATAALYLPTLALRYDLGYGWALDGQGTTVTIGDTVSATDRSTWRNSLSVDASLRLYDGGAREARVDQARQRLRGAESARREERLRVAFAVEEAFLRGLQAQRRAAALTAIVERRKDLYRALQRLLEAGTVGRARLEDAALELAADLTRLDDGRLELGQALAALTELSGDSYPSEGTSFADWPAPSQAEAGFGAEIPWEELPQLQVFDAELARLRAERQATRRGFLPSVGLYGNYRLYGADRERVGRTLQNLGGRDATLAVAVQWEFFSGWRDLRQLAHLDEELHRTEWQRLQRRAELERELGSLQQAALLAPQDADHLRRRQAATAAAAQSTERLRSEGLLDQVAALEREIELLDDALEADLLRLRHRAEAVRLRLWREGVGT